MRGLLYKLYIRGQLDTRYGQLNLSTELIYVAEEPLVYILLIMLIKI